MFMLNSFGSSSACPTPGGTAADEPEMPKTGIIKRVGEKLFVMKKIFGIIFISLLVFSTSLQAQVCNGVSAEAIPMNPQTGSYNNFGVRVTLSHTYYQDVTVTGYIFNDGDPLHSYTNVTGYKYVAGVPSFFTLTITAGNLTAETATNFYQTSPSENALVEINSVSPCPSNFTTPYDSIGIYHNLGLNNCKNSQSPIDCAISYGQSFFPEMFGQETISDIIDQAAYAALHDSTNYVPEYLSTEGKSYSSQLISMIDDIEESNQIDETINDIIELESDISESGLSENEKQILLIASSVARHSFNFWLANIDTMETVAMYRFTNNNPSLIIDPTLSSYDIPIYEIESFNNNTNFSLNNSNNNISYLAPGWLRKLLKVVVGDVVGAFVGAGVAALTFQGCGICVGFGALLGSFSGSIAAGASENLL